MQKTKKNRLYPACRNDALCHTNPTGRSGHSHLGDHPAGGEKSHCGRRPENTTAAKQDHLAAECPESVGKRTFQIEAQRDCRMDGKTPKTIRAILQ